MDCSLPGSSVCRIFQARLLEWVTISCSSYLLLVRIKLDGFSFIKTEMYKEAVTVKFDVPNNILKKYIKHNWKYKENWQKMQY